MRRIWQAGACALMAFAAAFSFAAPANADDLQQALISAYQNNPRLLAERARVREFDENYVQAQAAGRFTSSANASIGRSLSESQSSFFGTTNSVDTWLTPRNASVSIVQPLYQGGRVNSLKDQAKAGVLAARQGLRDAEQTVLLSAATAYLDVLRDEEAARIRRNNVMVLGRQLTAAQDRFDVGEGTRTDIAQANARLAASDIGLANADAQLAISRAAYVRFIGRPPEQLSAPPVFILPDNLTDAMLKGRANNPQLVAARYNESAARASIGVAKSAGKPVVSINGSLQGARKSSANVPLSESASITAQISVPIFSGGANRSRVRAAQQAQTRTKFETRETEQAVDQTISNLWAQVDAAKRSLAASRRQVDAAEIAFEGVELEQQVGTRNTLDVLDAEQELLNAKLSVVQAERNLNLARYQLLVTMGGFDAYSLGLDTAIYDPNANFEKVTQGKPLGFVSKIVPDNLPWQSAPEAEVID